MRPETGGIVKDDRYKLELLLNQAGVSVGMRAVEQQAHACSDKPAAALLRQSNCRMALL